MSGNGQLHDYDGDVSNLPSLPRGWSWSTIGEITLNLDGKRVPVKISDRANRSGPYPYYGASGIIDDIDDFIFDGEYLLIAEDGANLLSRSTPIAFRADGKFWVNNHAHVVQLHGSIPLAYLEWYLNATNLQFFITGTAQPKLNQVNLNRIPVPIAPLPEQNRIVGRIEELVSELEAGVAALKRAKANLKRYRAAVLKAAVEGKLTEEWRAKNPPKEPAAKLLERILKERRKKWEQDQLAAYEANGKQPPKNWRDKYQEPAGPDTASLPALPERWCWVAVEQLGDVQLGRQRSPKNRSKDYPTQYIRAANLTEGGLDVSGVLDMEFKPSEVETYRLVKGDIVVSEASGSPDQVGKPAVWNDELPLCCFQNTVIRLRPHHLASSAFLLTVFRQCYFSRIFAKVAAGVGINHLSAAKFARLAIPLAPEDEQAEVAAEVERRLSILAQSDALFTANLKRAARLRQSILKRAFEGKLVPQDPNDEPAAKLLERVRLESGEIAKGGDARRRKETTND